MSSEDLTRSMHWTRGAGGPGSTTRRGDMGELDSRHAHRSWCVDKDSLGFGFVKKGQEHVMQTLRE
eukprot:763895-Hanusia_phi.AAC.5